MINDLTDNARIPNVTFPDQKYPAIDAFSDDYFAAYGKSAGSVDRQRLAQAAALLGQAYVRGANVYTCGNGGSAAICNHLVCDHQKGIQTDTDVLPRVHSLSANIEIITAIANDISYDDIFVFQLRSMAQAGDVLITVSSSGESENVVRAVQWARDNDVDVIAMTGFAGGRSAQLATLNLHVDGDNYGVVEDVHQSLMHILAQYLRLQQMSEDLIRDRKF